MRPDGDRAAEGWVVHRRVQPCAHEFRYRAFYTLVEVDGAPVRDEVAALGVSVDRVLLLRQRKGWGARFNPVVFYFALRGQHIAGVVAEIHNTPWGERHRYLLDARNADASGRFRFAKTFHVSPFNPMDLDYEWRFDLAGGRIRIDMRLTRQGAPVMYAGLDLETRSLDRRARLRGALRYPLQGWATLVRIYWQALRLWLKGLTFYPHPRSHLDIRRSI